MFGYIYIYPYISEPWLVLVTPQAVFQEYAKLQGCSPTGSLGQSRCGFGPRSFVLSLLDQQTTKIVKARHQSWIVVATRTM